MNQSISFRIIDANLNRAREALRVMEEYARLGLEDADLSAAIKETRHALAAAVGKLEDGLDVNTAGKIAQAKACGSGERTPLGPPLVRGEVDGAALVRGEADGVASVRGEVVSRVSDDRPLPHGRGSEGSSLVRSRDIVGDVGCDVATSSEYERADAGQVARVAAKRLGEALRAVEEYGKVIDPAFAAAIEKIRYRGYELERRLHITMDARNRLAGVRLYVIITESLCKGDWLATAEAALHGGADCIQLREKSFSDRELLNRARHLADLCHEHDALFILNDRPDVALLSGADGVHLGLDDMPIAAARRILHPSSIVGVSTHTLEQVKAAASESPDYIAVGPMFPTKTKPQHHIAGPTMLAAARAYTSLPLVAIGGITATNVAKVRRVAPCRVCVCRSIIAESDVAAAASRLCTVVEGIDRPKRSG